MVQHTSVSMHRHTLPDLIDTRVQSFNKLLLLVGRKKKSLRVFEIATIHQTKRKGVSIFKEQKRKNLIKPRIP